MLRGFDRSQLSNRDCHFDRTLHSGGAPEKGVWVLVTSTYTRYDGKEITAYGLGLSTSSSAEAETWAVRNLATYEGNWRASKHRHQVLRQGSYDSSRSPMEVIVFATREAKQGQIRMDRPVVLQRKRNDSHTATLRSTIEALAKRKGNPAPCWKQLGVSRGVLALFCKRSRTAQGEMEELVVVHAASPEEAKALVVSKELSLLEIVALAPDKDDAARTGQVLKFFRELLDSAAQSDSSEKTPPRQMDSGGGKRG
jgi:hypothetical protein